MIVVGGGEGATVREVLRYPSVERVVMAELDGEVVDLCRKHLPTWSDGMPGQMRLDIAFLCFVHVFMYVGFLLGANLSMFGGFFVVQVRLMIHVRPC